MFRKEEDIIGTIEIAKNELYGIHTARAIENFPITKRKIHPELIKGYGYVKLAAITINDSFGIWNNDKKITAIKEACDELINGQLDGSIVVDALQGGAGTSTNMNVNEVLANRSLEILGEKKGSYDIICPTDTLNLHQSTNDTYPTALRIGILNLLNKLENKIITLQEGFQYLEREYSDVVKVGRTQMQDAVLTTVGREMGAYAEALSRDRWRVYKCIERIKVVNIGGTAIGTGLGAPRDYIFQMTEKLKELTGLPLARAENLVEATQNTDAFVEVSGILKTFASNLIKIANDLRFLSSGPEAGISEIILPQLQAGSSIMPGKINPVIPEAVIQGAINYIGYDQMVTSASYMGNLELNQFMPLIADSMLNGISTLINITDIFYKKCVKDITINKERCQSYVDSSTAIITALVETLGYEKATEISKISKQQNKTIKEIVLKMEIISKEELDNLVSPEMVTRLGSPRISKK